MTSDPALRGARALAAAQAKRDAAASEAAYELLAIAELAPLSDLQQAQVARLRAQMEFARSRGGDTGAPPVSEAATQLLDAAKRLENLDDDLARETYLEALAAAMYAGRLGEPGVLASVAEAALAAVNRVPTPHRAIDLLLSGMANRITGGMSAGSDLLRTALELMCTQAQQNDGQALRGMTLGLAIVQESAVGELWDDAIYRQLATDVVRQARDAGALAVLPPALAYRAGVHVLAGEFATAATLIEEAASITAATGYTPLRYHSLALAAWRGIPADAEGVIEAATADGTASGEGRVLGLTGYISAVLYNGLGRYEEAFVAAREGCVNTRTLASTVGAFSNWLKLRRALVTRKRRRRRCSGWNIARAPAEPTGVWGLWRVLKPCWPTTSSPTVFSPKPLNALSAPASSSTTLAPACATASGCVA